MKRKPTIAAGGRIERNYVVAYARRQMRKDRSDSEGTYDEGYRHALRHLVDWLREQPKRTKRPGGLGR